MKESKAGGRGDETRQRLLDAAIDVFGKFGFDAVSTRMISDAAEVNLQAIPYYFKNKEGLYLSVAEYISDQMRVRLGPTVKMVSEGLAALPTKGVSSKGNTDAARALLLQLLEGQAKVLWAEESEPWARFIVREQANPTEAFERIYEGIMKPMLQTVDTLLAIILNTEPGSEAIRIRSLTLIGQILVFRVAHTAALRHIGWRKLGKKEHEALFAVITENVAALGPSTNTRRGKK